MISSRCTSPESLCLFPRFLRPPLDAQFQQRHRDELSGDTPDAPQPIEGTLQHAANQTLMSDVLRQLSQSNLDNPCDTTNNDLYSYIEKMVTDSPTASTYNIIVESLPRHPDALNYALSCLAHNTNDQDLLRRLTMHNSVKVTGQVLNNPVVPPDILRIHSTSHDEIFRGMVARSPNLPADARQVLLDDANEQVRGIAETFENQHRFGHAPPPPPAAVRCPTRPSIGAVMNPPPTPASMLANDGTLPVSPDELSRHAFAANTTYYDLCLKAASDPRSQPAVISHVVAALPTMPRDPGSDIAIELALNTAVTPAQLHVVAAQPYRAARDLIARRTDALPETMRFINAQATVHTPSADLSL